MTMKKKIHNKSSQTYKKAKLRISREKRIKNLVVVVVVVDAIKKKKKKKLIVYF
jgi:hypothetical protein